METEAIELKPAIKRQFLLMVFSFLGIGVVPKPLGVEIEDYDKVVLCGPIWSGTLISPLKGFLNKFRNKINNLIFVTCCGSKDEEKDSRFGYSRIFNKVKELMGSRVLQCEAFPILLTVAEEERKDEKAILELRLTEETFKGEIKERFDHFIDNLTGTIQSKSLVAIL